MKRHAKQFLALFFSLTLTVTGIPTNGISVVRATEEVMPITQEQGPAMEEEVPLATVAEDQMTEIVNATSDYDTFGKAVASLCQKWDSTDSRICNDDDAYTLRRLIVKTNGEEIDWKTLGAVEMIQGPENNYILQFNDELATKDAEKWLNANPKVIYAEPDLVMELNEEPVTEEKKDHVHDIVNPASEDATAESPMDEVKSLSWGVTRIGAKAYADSLAEVSKPEIIVAVLDTGADLNHPFLAGRLTDGYDYIDNDEEPLDGHSHGTHVAGTIVDCTEGLAGKITIMPIKVMGDDGKGTSSMIALGIRYAVDHGAKVINMSLGGGHSSSLHDAVAYARKQNVVVVAAAGNQGSNLSTKVHCPAHIPECITVISVDTYENIAITSNYGEVCDVAAPGVSIYSSVPGGKYGTKSGTSMASPHVAAVAALLRYKYPERSNVDIEEFINIYTRDLGDPGKDIYYGNGIIDITPLLRVDPSTDYSTILFDANGGTNAPASMRKNFGIAIAIPQKKPARNGYTFVGWATTADGQAVYQPGAAYTDDKDVTLYAVWEPLEIENSFPKDYVVDIVNADDKNVYSFIPNMSGSYTFESKGNYDTYAEILNVNGELIAKDDESGNGSNFKLTYDFTAGTQYYVKAKMFRSYDTGTFTMTATTSVPILILTQPESVTANVGTKAVFSVKAEGRGLTYQWKYSMDDGTTWKNSTASCASSPVFSITAAEKWNGMLLRCVITDEKQNSQTTASAKLTVPVTVKPVISGQPVSVTATEGQKASFTVEATGEGLTYQWYYSMDQGATFKKSTASTAVNKTFVITAAEKWNNMQLKCVVTNAEGGSVTSSVAELSVKAGNVFTLQPTDVTVAVGTKAQFKVAATGEGLTYQWYYSMDQGATFKKSTASTAMTDTFVITAATKWNGMLLKCVVTDADGGKLTTTAAKLTVN